MEPITSSSATGSQLPKTDSKGGKSTCSPLQFYEWIPYWLVPQVKTATAAHSWEARTATVARSWRARTATGVPSWRARTATAALSWRGRTAMAALSCKWPLPHKHCTPPMAPFSKVWAGDGFWSYHSVLGWATMGARWGYCTQISFRWRCFGANGWAGLGVWWSLRWLDGLGPGLACSLIFNTE